jgi:HSP90 family molecular chaperone
LPAQHCDRLSALDRQDDPKPALYAELLHGQALLTEGATLPDPAAFSRRLAELMASPGG